MVGEEISRAVHQKVSVADQVEGQPEHQQKGILQPQEKGYAEHQRCKNAAQTHPRQVNDPVLLGRVNVLPIAARDSKSQQFAVLPGKQPEAGRAVSSSFHGPDVALFVNGQVYQQGQPNGKRVTQGVQEGHALSFRRKLLEMSVPDSSSALTVTDPEQARLLVHPDHMPIIDVLLGRELSVGAVAGEVNWPLDRVHYRVKKLCRAGLLHVVREEKRAGRPIRVYSTVAAAFFIPFTSFTHASLEEKFLRFEQELAHRVVRCEMRLLHQTFPNLAQVGPRIYRDAQGRATEDLAFSPGEGVDELGPDYPAMLSEWRGVRLPFSEAKALQAELNALLERYAPSQRPPSGEQVYALRLLLLPVQAEDWA